MNEKPLLTKKVHNNTNNNTTNTSDMILLVEKKIDFFKDVIQKTIIHVQHNKHLEILGISEVASCIEKLGILNKKISDLTEFKNVTADGLINCLQIINNDLSSLLKTYGTESLEDLLLICFGNNNKIITNETDIYKLDLLKKYFHPISYKVVSKKEESKKDTDVVDNSLQTLIISDVSSNYKQFYMKVNGVKIYIHNSSLNKSLIIFGFLDDIVIELLNNKYIDSMNKSIKDFLPEDAIFHGDTFEKFVQSFCLKEYLIYNSHLDIYDKYAGYLSQNASIHQKQISQVVKEFITDDIYSKRNTLINLLIKSSNYENQYLAYLLYDLLSNDTNSNVDTIEQVQIFDSFPWSIKQCFKEAMKKTIQYTNELSNFDINKIPLEQQICLLKASDSVKEKAMMKLKEVKAKSEDTGSKARQYLDGLLKIPFNVYKREPVLNIMSMVRSQFKDIYNKYNLGNTFTQIPSKEKYTSIEILKYNKLIQEKNNFNNKAGQIDEVKQYLLSGDKKMLNNNILQINKIIQNYKPQNNKDEKQSKTTKISKMKCSLMNKEQIKEELEKFIENCKLPENAELLNETITHFIKLCNTKNMLNNELVSDINKLNVNMNQITTYISDVKKTLDNSVYGHDKAKKQIERVIAQWINGDDTSNCSHVLGFEGNPGIGKTTLAKGLSECLKDENGNSRPFSLIALGGDSNASTLIGHSYTYVGSTWGQIVQILMDKKCLNPIILFDEVDKISKTEHGKEITGILTHLLDPTQNNCFQDKYFSGIDLDLSKVLFILSYNDVECIDKVLLDRVHRIKFDSLSLEDKIVICNKHLLPELYSKIGLKDMINFSDDVLKFIIEEYTLEPGVRKLKEKLFEIVGEINLNILKDDSKYSEIPINVTINDIKMNYFKDKGEIITRKVPEKSIIGYANGMYATTLGTGGTLPIHAKLFPSSNFLELKLTGLQQDVMKESMHIALTIAWNLLSEERKKKLRKLYDGQNNKYGINIHAGDGAISKDGPSAGVTITSVIYSLLNEIPIKSQFGMTGEIQLDGSVTAIGGLNFKILGSIKASVKNFIYPKENEKDFKDFYEKYKNKPILEGIKFYPMSHINEVLDLILDK